MRLHVRCPSAPWVNTTTAKDEAIDLAFNLSEEYQCDVDLWYDKEMLSGLTSRVLYTTIEAN